MSYEATLFPRATDAAADLAVSVEMIFSPDSPKKLIEMFDEFVAQAAAEQASDMV